MRSTASDCGQHWCQMMAERVCALHKRDVSGRGHSGCGRGVGRLEMLSAKEGGASVSSAKTAVGEGTGESSMLVGKPA